MSKTMELLLRFVGSVLESAIIELYRYDGDPNVTINDVQLSVGNTKFVLGCSGDGSVFVKKGQATLSNYGEGVISSKLHTLEIFSGCSIENIEVKDTSIVITLDNSKLEIANDDDELVIIRNGEKMIFDTLI